METRKCAGHGDCWDPNGAGTKFPNVVCSHNCELKPCANARVCSYFKYPEWVTDFKHGVCIPCSRDFGKVLTFSEDECPTCFETTECVTLPNCTHKQCISCFKRCRYGAPDTSCPEFPYPELYDEYEDTYLDLRWKYDTLIIKWLKDTDKWAQERDDNWSREANLRLCPLCRK